MDSDFFTYYAVIFLPLLLGFFGHAAYDNWKKTYPLSMESIVSNHGSIMMYLLWQSALFCGATFAVFFATKYSIESAGEMFEGTYDAVVGVTYFVVGVIYSRLAILRARDAGRSRRFALLAVVPVVSLALLAAEPKRAPERPDYVPRSALLRFLIGFVAFWAIVAVRGWEQKASEQLLDDSFDVFVADRIVELVEQTYPSLPLRLDEVTTLVAVDVDKTRKRISYQYRVSEPGLEEDYAQAFLETEIKPDALAISCAEGLFYRNGWAAELFYADLTDKLLAFTETTEYDCWQYNR